MDASKSQTISYKQLYRKTKKMLEVEKEKNKTLEKKNQELLLLLILLLLKSKKEEPKESESKESESKESESKDSESKESESKESEPKESESKESEPKESESKNDKEKIIKIFETNVKGKKIHKDANNCGSEGHWLEKQMGIKPNSNNEPDKLGYEQKKDSNKITFGDWSASEYIFKNKKISRDDFLKTFGSPNPKKNNRYSWSGKIFPKYGFEYNYAGQRMRFLENEDLVIEYSYPNDTREEKISYFDDFKGNEPIIIARWTKCKLEKHILNKFGVKGFYICKKNKENVYDKICFGKVIDFQFFKNNLQNSKIILDSGMYQGNSRYYSQFRADKSLWYDLITEEY